MSEAQERIAVSSLDGRGLDAQVSPHFGRCAAFTVVQVEDGRITDHDVVRNPYAEQHSCGQVTTFLAELRANALLTGGMGRRAVDHLAMSGIRASIGHTGTVRGAVEAYLAKGPLAGDVCSGGHHPDGCAEH